MELLKRIQELLRDKLEVNATLEADDLTFLGKCGPVTARIRITASESALTVCGHFPVFASARRRQAACEAMALINWGLSVAHFTLDTDGEVVCIAQLVLYDAVPTDRQIARLIHRVWGCMSLYSEPLVRILTTDADPALTISEVEKPDIQMRRASPTDVTIN